MDKINTLVVDKICFYLSDKDILSLKAVCKSLYRHIERTNFGQQIKRLQNGQIPHKKIYLNQYYVMSVSIVFCLLVYWQYYTIFNYQPDLIYNSNRIVLIYIIWLLVWYYYIMRHHQGYLLLDSLVLIIQWINTILSNRLCSKKPKFIVMIENGIKSSDINDHIMVYRIIVYKYHHLSKKDRDNLCLLAIKYDDIQTFPTLSNSYLLKLSWILIALWYNARQIIYYWKTHPDIDISDKLLLAKLS